MFEIERIMVILYFPVFLLIVSIFIHKENSTGTSDTPLGPPPKSLIHIHNFGIIFTGPQQANKSNFDTLTFNTHIVIGLLTTVTNLYYKLNPVIKCPKFKSFGFRGTRIQH